MEIELQIQEWFVTCNSFKDLARLYERIMSECDLQVEYMGRVIALKNGFYKGDQQE